MSTYSTEVKETDEQRETTVREAAGNCEVIKTTNVWSSLHLEFDKYGNHTGAKFYLCRDCGREVLEGIKRENVSHRDGCRFDEN